MIKGIDLSVWNGDVNWELAAKDINFAVLRAGYGKIMTQKDSRFESYYAGCKKYGVKVGIYWYSYAKTVNEAEMEARTCLSILNKRELDMPIWYDIEENSTFATGKENVSKIADTFLTIIQNAGYQGGIYSSCYTFQNYFTEEVKDKYDIWLAHVASDGGELLSTNYPGKKDMWQYSWKGHVNGISGDVDMDYCYKDYFTTAEDGTKDEQKNDNSTQEEKQSGDTEENFELTFSTPDVFYSAFIGKWLDEVKNCGEDSLDFAGLKNMPISGFTVRTSEGIIKYRVHVRGGSWLGWVCSSDINDWAYGVAGIKGRIIDGIQMELLNMPEYDLLYRVSSIGTDYYPWVNNWDNSSAGYAGIYGRIIDRVQVKIVKKEHQG